MRYCMEIIYLGTNYCGWQSQSNSTTIQTTIEQKLFQIFNIKIDIVGSGRTDSGVHAKKQVAHFDIDRELQCDKVTYQLNSILPDDIVIKRIQPVDDDFHARFSATIRTYIYRITKTKNPFLQLNHAHIHKALNLSLMNIASQELLHYSDFEAFSKVNTDVKNFLCTIYSAHWREDEEIIHFTIRANRFLRGMVRIIVGYMIKIGENKLSVAEFCKIIEDKTITNRPALAPACGLTLEDVDYSNEKNLESK